jgi:hypothetical protein
LKDEKKIDYRNDESSDESCNLSRMAFDEGGSFHKKHFNYDSINVKPLDKQRTNSSMKNSQEHLEDKDTKQPFNITIKRPTINLKLHLPQRESIKMGNISRFHNKSIININKYSIVEMEDDEEESELNSSEVDSVDSVKSFSIEDDIQSINSENIFSEFNNDSPKNYLITPKYQMKFKFIKF